MLGFAALSKKNLLTRGRACLGALAVAFIIALTTWSPVALAQNRTVPQEARGSGPSRQAVSHEAGGEASLVLPDLSRVKFLGVSGHSLLLVGLIFCALGLFFGL